MSWWFNHEKFNHEKWWQNGDIVEYLWKDKGFTGYEFNIAMENDNDVDDVPINSGDFP